VETLIYTAAVMFRNDYQVKYILILHVHFDLLLCDKIVCRDSDYCYIIVLYIYSYSRLFSCIITLS